jgi:hypothetical protein
MDYADIVERETEEMRLSAATRWILRMLYASAHTVFASREQRPVLFALGVADKKLSELPLRDSGDSFWAQHLRAIADDRPVNLTPDETPASAATVG